MTATFSVTSDDIVKGAMKICGALSPVESAVSQELVDGRFALNLMLKSWAQEGYKGWLYQTKTFPFVASKPSWTLAEAGADVTMARPERIAQAWWADLTVPPNSTPMIQLTREQYNRLTPKLQIGTPNSWYYDPQLVAGVFYPWPLCLNTQGTFYISVQRPIDDLTSGSSTFDIPQVAYLALQYGLAQQWGILAFRCDERTAGRIDKWAPIYIAKAMDYTEEDGSVYFQPNPQGGFFRA